MLNSWQIAKRLYYTRNEGHDKSRPAVRVALVGVIIGMVVMVVAVCIVIGFKQQVTNKVAGFGSHIQVVNFDSNSTFELQPIRVSDSLVAFIDSLPLIEHVSLFTSKPGILKTDSAFQGVVFKGTDYWDYFQANLLRGFLPEHPNDILMSLEMAQSLQLDTADNVLCYFLGDELRVRRLYISGIYSTCMSEMDDLFILGHNAMVRQLNSWSENEASGMEILVSDLRNLDQAADLVYFATANQLDDNGNALYTQTLRQLNPQIFGWLDLLDMNVVIILVLMLCVAGFSIITGLVILIMDNISFIGTLKALGANNKLVRQIFIYESALLVGKGMLWGNIIGLALVLVQYITHVIPLESATYYVSYVPVAFPVGWLLALNAGTLFICLLVMIGPSAIASRIDPAKVMQFE